MTKNYVLIGILWSFNVYFGNGYSTSFVSKNLHPEYKLERPIAYRRCTRELEGAFKIQMGRRRKGEGAQRSRWAPREVSPDFQVPQGVAEEIAAANRVAKIEALVARRQSGLIVVLEDPSDELNAGVVFRSCDAFGATEVWIIHNGLKPETSMRPHVERGEAFEPESRGIALASASASRWVASRTLESTHDAITKLRADGYFSVATCFTDRSRYPNK